MHLPLMGNDFKGVRKHNTGYIPGKDDSVMFAVSEFGKTFSTLQEGRVSLKYLHAVWSYLGFSRGRFQKVAYLPKCVSLSNPILCTCWQNPAFDSLFSCVDSYFLKWRYLGYIFQSHPHAILAGVRNCGVNQP